MAAIASGSRSGTSLKSSGFQRVNVVLPEPFAPAMKVSVERITAMTEQTSFGAQPEFPAGVFSRQQPRRGLPGLSFVLAPSSSQPYTKNTPTQLISRYFDIPEINNLHGVCSTSGSQKPSDMRLCRARWAGLQNCVVRPTRLCPSAHSMAATAEGSTPPDVTDGDVGEPQLKLGQDLEHTIGLVFSAKPIGNFACVVRTTHKSNWVRGKHMEKASASHINADEGAARGFS